MTTRHTSAPWHTYSNDKGELWVTSSDGSMAICQVICKDGLGTEGMDTRDIEGIYNAHLLAAAPRLLDALEGTVRELASHHGYDCNCSACKKVRSAIESTKPCTYATPSAAQAEGRIKRI